MVGGSAVSNFAPTKADMKLLEAMFADEIEQALSGRGMPFQTRSKRIQILAEEGYVMPLKVVLGGRLPVSVTGWQLSHLGRLTYCATCKDDAE